MTTVLNGFLLKYQLSYKTLFAVRLGVVQRAYSLADIMAGHNKSVPEKDANAAGILYRGLAADTIEQIESGKWIKYVRATYPRYFTKIEGNFEDFQNSLSSKTRSTLRRKIKKFETYCGGTLNFRVYKSPDELMVFQKLAREISIHTYQEKLMNSGLPASAEFIQSMQLLASQNAVRGFLLFCNERPVSYLYSEAHGRFLNYDYLGYLPEYTEHSVGTVLQWKAFEYLFSEGIFEYFDFTEGEGLHKALFSTGKFDCADVLFLRPSLSSRALIASHRQFNRTVEGLATFADRWDIRRRIRAIMRKQ
jgi:Acetyltransferase (GNAT) domain